MEVACHLGEHISVNSENGFVGQEDPTEKDLEMKIVQRQRVGGLA